MGALMDDREEDFAQGVALGLAQGAAYLDAGYPAKNDQQAAVYAGRLLKRRPDIDERIAELKREARTAARNAEFLGTVEELAAMLLEDRMLARKRGQMSAAISADNALMKLYGLGSETKRLVGDPNAPLEVREIKLVAPKMTGDGEA